MMVVTWNCNGAFRNKFENLFDLNADIFIIQECENPIESKSLKYIEWSENHLWIGDTKNKGLGIFANKNFKLEKQNWSNLYKDHSVKHFLPCSVNNKFNLLAVWTHQNNSPNFGYIGQFWKYLQLNKDKFGEILIVGDFNSNTIWDEWDRWWNHSDVVRDLEETGIESLYHKYFNEEQGKETKPTFHLHRKIEKPYHIDYIFGAKRFSNKLKKVEVGKFDKWIELSDHLPLICEFEL